MKTKRPHFRFEGLEVWREAASLAQQFHDVAGRLETRKLYRYAEQLRSAGLSLANNIAEGSGSDHNAEFRQYLNIARRSCFEDASMLLVFEKMNLIESAECTSLLNACDCLCRKLTRLRNTLR
jgi:four helix bundle protein